MFPMPPGRRPPGPWPFPPRGDPDRRPPPTPTLREMQMQAAHRGRGRGPGGWQAGGIVGRNMFNPRAAGAAAMRRNIPRPQERIRFEGPDWPRPRGGDRPPGGWQEGGAVGPRPKLLPAYASWPLPPGLNYDFVGARRQQGAESIAERMANQARRQASRSPGGWQVGGAVDSTEALMAERDRLQQQLQTADEAMAQEILMQIMEINKELEMAAAPGMAGGGVASLMGDVRGYQGGGAPRRTGALHGSIIGDPSSGRWTEHFPAIGQNPIYSGWGNVSWNPNKWSTVTSFNNQNLPYPNRPPGGG